MLNKQDRSEIEEKFLTFKDQILGEVNSLRDECAITIGYRDMIANLEARLEIVEQKLRLP